MNSLIDAILATCELADIYHSQRNINSVMNAATSELGELAEEVNIASGVSYKEPGPDGVEGEAIDLILAAVDLLYVNNRKITEEDMVRIATPKLQKWHSKIAKAHAEGKLK